MWLIENNFLLTKDNLIKRKWVGDASCYFGPQVETIAHLFFACLVAKVVWGCVVSCLKTSFIPRNLEQCWVWLD